MAYTRRRATRGYSRSRPARTRTGYTSARRRTGRSPVRRSSAPQTVRIELVGMPANPISRGLPPSMAPKAPKKANY